MVKKFAAVLLLLLFSAVLIPQSALAASDSIVISAIQTGGSGSAQYRHEFVELYNTTQHSINLTGYTLIFTNEDDTKELLRVSLDYTIGGTEFYLVARDSYINYVGNTSEYLPDEYFVFATVEPNVLIANGGHVKLLNTQGVEVDKVGYGTAEHPEGAAAEKPAGGHSLKRCTADTVFIDTDDNSQDFLITPTEHSVLGPACVSEEAGQEELETDPTEGTDQETTGYPLVFITELLPNPDAALGQEEYIELYNPNEDAVDLAGYTLKSSSGSKNTYIFPANTILQSGSYLAVKGVTLTNSGGSAWLLDPSGITISQTEVYANAKKGQSWAEIHDLWQFTIPTPGMENISIQTHEGKGTDGKELEPCAEGKYRNPETNRCKNIEESSGNLTPCKEGQERNPETNRCRSTATASAALTPCRPGQERNPETNRCRAIASAGTTLTPCKEGQERNPQTNRCRNVASATSGASPEESKDTNPAKINYAAVGIVSVTALGYGLYEYRNELRNLLARMRPKNGPSISSNS